MNRKVATHTRRVVFIPRGVLIEKRVIQFSRSVMSDPLRPHELQHASPPVHHQLPESTQIHVHWVSDAIQPSHPLLSPSPLALNLSQHQGLFKWVSSSHQVAKVLEFQLQHQSFQWTPSPSNEHSFRMDWLNLVAVQGTLKSLLQHHSSKASILRCSAFFIVQLSHPYRTTGKTIALTRWTFVDRVMSLVFNKLSMLVITFLPRSSEVAQSCPTLCDTMDCSLPDPSLHGILQARVLEWVSISFSRVQGVSVF